MCECDDAERLARALDAIPAAQGDEQLSVEPVLEVLAEPRLLRHASIVGAAGRALGFLIQHYELSIADSEEVYPGIPALLAHPDGTVRAWAQLTFDAWPPATREEAFLRSQDWQPVLEWLLQGAAVADAGQGTVVSGDAEREPRGGVASACFRCSAGHAIGDAFTPDPKLAWSAVASILTHLGALDTSSHFSKELILRPVLEAVEALVSRIARVSAAGLGAGADNATCVDTGRLLGAALGVLPATGRAAPGLASSVIERLWLSPGVLAMLDEGARVTTIEALEQCVLCSLDAGAWRRVWR